MQEMTRAEEYAERRRSRKHDVRKKKNYEVTAMICMGCLCLMVAMGIYTISVCSQSKNALPIPEYSVPLTTELPVSQKPTLDPVHRKLQDYAHSHGLSVSDYPQSFVELLERNPEAEQFVLEYPNHKEGKPDLTQYDRSKGVPLFMQWDPQWGYEEYGSDAIGITGCGPTCLAMVGYYLTGDSWFAPDQVAQFAEKNGYYIEGSGSAWALISEGGRKLGMDVTEIPLDQDRIMTNLQCDNPIICVVGPGDFTTDGHFIVLSGFEGNQIKVNDPNSQKNSEKLWSYEQLAPQIGNLWVLRK